MPWPTYSERFIATEETGTLMVWECPEGMRAVLQQIQVVTASFDNAACLVKAHGIAILSHVFQAPTSTISVPTRVVIYERETFSLYVWGAGAAAILSGSVFADPDGKPKHATDGRADGAYVPSWSPLEA